MIGDYLVTIPMCEEKTEEGEAKKVSYRKEFSDPQAARNFMRDEIYSKLWAYDGGGTGGARLIGVQLQDRFWECGALDRYSLIEIQSPYYGSQWDGEIDRETKEGQDAWVKLHTLQWERKNLP